MYKKIPAVARAAPEGVPPSVNKMKEIYIHEKRPIYIKKRPTYMKRDVLTTKETFSGLGCAKRGLVECT